MDVHHLYISFTYCPTSAVDTSVACLRNAKKLKRCTVYLCWRDQVNMSRREVSKTAQQCSFCCVVTASPPPIHFATYQPADEHFESNLTKLRVIALNLHLAM